MSKKSEKNSNYITSKSSAQNPVEKKPFPKWAIALICAALVVGIIIAVIALAGGDKACAYAKNRDIEGHDITYVEISVKDYGKITLLLDATTAPETVANFVRLANEGFYDGLTFHRIVEDFMIQGGDPEADSTGGSNETIKGEFDRNNHYNDISHIKGVISMARGAYDYNSASSQFFICNADSTFLDGQYAAFGYVIDGLGVVDKITSKTVKYADYESGIIKDKSKQAVIEYVKVLESVE